MFGPAFSKQNKHDKLSMIPVWGVVCLAEIRNVLIGSSWATKDAVHHKKRNVWLKNRQQSFP